MKRAAFMVAIADMLPWWLAPVALWLIERAERLAMRQIEAVFRPVGLFAIATGRLGSYRPAYVEIQYGNLMALQQQAQAAHNAYLQNSYNAGLSQYGNLNSLIGNSLGGLLGL